MKIEVFTSIDELKADRVARNYSKKELIAQKNAARAINKIRINDSKVKKSRKSTISR